MSTPNQSSNLLRLREWIVQFPSALVAYSGGVDSAVVMAAVHQALGAKALACIGVSASLAQREQRAAISLAERVGAKYRLLETHETADPNYAANPANRCYFCKSALFDQLRRLAQAEQFGVLLDGNNADDLREVRAGRRAAAERGVRSPLAELGLTKQMVREIAQALDLPVWDKPAMACLASRVPQGVTITPKLLAQIERAEDVLAALGFRQFRVRHHGDVARIELPQEELSRAVEQSAAIVAGVRATGYRFVCLDLAGFRSGSLAAAGELTPVTVSAAGAPTGGLTGVGPDSASEGTSGGGGTPGMIVTPVTVEGRHDRIP
jgi:uncharacterized protein